MRLIVGLIQGLYWGRTVCIVCGDRDVIPIAQNQMEQKIDHEMESEGSAGIALLTSG